MDKYRFQISLRLRAPVLSQALDGQVFGVDVAALRGRDRQPVLPGTLIRGNLRHAWEAFAEYRIDHAPSLDDVRRWLGAGSEASDDSPSRGRLRFADFWQADGSEHPVRRHRVRRDPATGAAASRALQVVESPHPPQAEPVYRGWIEARAGAGEAAWLLRWLRKGLEWTPALGAFKGVGYGRVLAVTVEIETLKTGGPAVEVSPDGFGLSLRLDRPFCFARPHLPGDNLFRSERFIPGGAIKGALAHRLNLGTETPDSAFPLVCRHFAALRVTHAFPAPENANRRPISLPASLVIVEVEQKKVAEPRLFDLALYRGPGLIQGRAPRFPIDWKNQDFEQAVKAGLGYSEPDTRLTVRTAIGAGTGAAREHQLFAYETVDPAGLDWLGDVDLGHPAIPAGERAGLAAELARLLGEGLAGLGKTEALAAVKLQPERHAAAVKSRGWLVEGRAVVVLQTAALLLPNPEGLPATHGEAALHRAYAAAWTELSDGSLELEYGYTRQTLFGGQYLWRRFGGARLPYAPQLLTLPGGVFVLKALDPPVAAEKLEAWQRHGLPQLAATPGGECWEKNPCVAANGYGEIAVNLDLHWQYDPKEAWHGLD